MANGSLHALGLVPRRTVRAIKNERARTETLNGDSIGHMFCLNDNNYQGGPLSGLG